MNRFKFAVSVAFRKRSVQGSQYNDFKVPRNEAQALCYRLEREWVRGCVGAWVRGCVRNSGYLRTFGYFSKNSYDLAMCCC